MLMTVPTAAAAAGKATVTILGLGSLLSERSSRTTFPDLTNFRLGRVSNKYRRVFGHPASIFFQRGLANKQTKEFSSLSAEEIIFDADADADAESNRDNDHVSSQSQSQYRGGFICSVFEVPREQVFLEDDEEKESKSVGDGDDKREEKRRRKPKPTGAFLEREEEFDIVEVNYVDLSSIDDNNSNSNSSNNKDIPVEKIGVLCTRYTDDDYIKRWGKERFDEHYSKYGIDTIWGYKTNSGLLPCRVYLKHCYLASQSQSMAMGSGSSSSSNECFNSFLDETFLVDRKTTIRQYLKDNPNLIKTTIPPPGFEERYSG